LSDFMFKQTKGVNNLPHIPASVRIKQVNITAKTKGENNECII